VSVFCGPRETKPRQAARRPGLILATGNRQAPMTDADLLRMAIRLAERKSRDGSRGPFGAVIARGGRVVSAGWNRVVEGRDPSAHAEIVAIRRACRRLRTHSLAGCDIYCSCEPCPMCLAAIYWARIGAVHFACTAADAAAAGFDDVRIRRQLRMPRGRRSVRAMQALRREGRAVFAQWRANPRRAMY